LSMIPSAWSALAAKAKSQRLPTDTVDEEGESCPDTPFSQASTAPSTPLRLFLPDPLGCDMCMSMLCEKITHGEKADAFNAPAQPIGLPLFMSTPPLSVCMSQWWTEYRQHGMETMLDSCEWSRQSVCTEPRSQQQFAVLGVVGNYYEYQARKEPRSQELFDVLGSVGNHYEYQARKEPRSQQRFAVLECVENYNKYQQTQYKHLPRSQQFFVVLGLVGNHFEYQARKEPRSQQLFNVLGSVGNCYEYQARKAPRSQQQFAVLESVGNYYEYQPRKAPRDQQQFAVLESADSHNCPVLKNGAPIQHFGLDIDGLMRHFGLNVKEAIEGAEPSHFDIEDDEWTQVNPLYIPSESDGMCILSPDGSTTSI